MDKAHREEIIGLLIEEMQRLRDTASDTRDAHESAEIAKQMAHIAYALLDWYRYGY